PSSTPRAGSPWCPFRSAACPGAWRSMIRATLFGIRLEVLLTSRLRGEVDRAISAFTRVFDALWRGRVRGALDRVRPSIFPLTPTLSRQAGRESAPPTRRQAFRPLALVAWALVLASQAFAQPTEPRQKLTIGYVEIEGDRRYEPIMAERLVLKAREHPFDGARIGLDDAKILARVLKIDFDLERITVKSSAEVAAAVQQAETRNIRFFLIDAPAEA